MIKSEWLLSDLFFLRFHKRTDPAALNVSTVFTSAPNCNGAIVSIPECVVAGFGEYWFILEKMTVHSIPIKSLHGSRPVLLLGETHCIKCKANWMRKAKYKPWQVSAHQKWILINAVTKWDMSEGVFIMWLGRGRDYGQKKNKKNIGPGEYI